MISNYVGFALNNCMEKDVNSVLLIGHIGKLAKFQLAALILIVGFVMLDLRLLP